MIDDFMEDKELGKSFKPDKEFLQVLWSSTQSTDLIKNVLPVSGQRCRFLRKPKESRN
jgi:hypothetical protein